MSGKTAITMMVALCVTIIIMMSYVTLIMSNTPTQ